MPRAWTLDGASRSKALSSQGPGAFSFRARLRVMTKPLRAVMCEGIPSGELCFPATETGVPLLSLKEDTMSVANQGNALHPVQRLRRPHVAYFSDGDRAFQNYRDR